MEHRSHCRIHIGLCLQGAALHQTRSNHCLDIFESWRFLSHPFESIISGTYLPVGSSVFTDAAKPGDTAFVRVKFVALFVFVLSQVFPHALLGPWRPISLVYTQPCMLAFSVFFFSILEDIGP